MEPLTTAANKWTFTQKIFFRFFFVYFVLYCFPFPLDAFEFTKPITKPFYDLLEWFVGKTGGLFFAIEPNLITPFEKGDDDASNYIFVFNAFLLALLIALLWSFADRRKMNYEILNQLVLLYLRLYLACMMFDYGFHKLYPIQRTPISVSRLELPYGMQRPSFVLWHFLGYSKTFTMFAGMGEVIGGLLLLWRRTKTLGAIILTGVMSAVVMINICYGIGVTLFSLHLLLIAIIVWWEDRKRLANFFLLNKPTATVVHVPLIKHVVWRKILLISLYVLIGCMLYKHITENRNIWNESIHRHRPLMGIYNTEYFIRASDTVPPLQTDSLRWKQVIIDRRFYSSVKLSTDSIMHSNAVVDTVQHSIHFYFTKYDYNSEPFDSAYMVYSLPDASHLFLQGIWKNDSIRVMLKKYDLNNYPLYRE